LDKVQAHIVIAGGVKSTEDISKMAFGDLCSLLEPNGIFFKVYSFAMKSASKKNNDQDVF
jgi:hypothetical protein